jgi:GAF domain-containing protein
VSIVFQHIPPSKLYAKLLACRSADERAQVTLDFLCRCTGSARGYLFLGRAHGLCAAAHSGQGSPTADLVAEVERIWREEQEIEPDSNRTRTIDLAAHLKPDAALENQLWKSASGVAYIRHVLGTYRGPRWTPVGIVMLEAGATLAPLRNAYIEVVCNAFIAAGEVPEQPVDAPLTR